MQKAAAFLAQAHETLQRAAQGAQNGVDPVHAARVAAAYAAQTAAAKAKAAKVKAEAEEAEGAENVVAGAAVSVEVLGNCAIASVSLANTKANTCVIPLQPIQYCHCAGA